MFAAILTVLIMAVGAFFALKRINKKIAIAVAVIIFVLGSGWLFNYMSKISDTSGGGEPYVPPTEKSGLVMPGKDDDQKITAKSPYNNGIHRSEIQ